MRRRVSLLDTRIDNVTLDELGERIAMFVRSGRPHQVVPANVDFLRLACEDDSFRELVNAADLVVADGMPLVWAARLVGDPLPRRISGCELMLESACVAAKHDFSVFLLGAVPGVAHEVAAVLQARLPGLRVAGTYAPPPLPLTSLEEERTIRIIQEMRPDILFVAFGAPLQERWIQSHMHHLGVPVCIGVGGAFDMLSGRVRRAPLWMQNHGLEWLYRLIQEPGRLWKRYFIHDLPIFVRLLVHARMRSRSAGSPTLQPPLPVVSRDPIGLTNQEARTVEESGAHIA